MHETRQSMAPEAPHVVIVGGGTAGWLCAAKIAARYRKSTCGRLSVTVIESADVPTIGVGEGTWPSMRRTLRDIGVEETAFLSTCNATFKQGSHFIDWTSDGLSFYHPFTPPQGFETVNAAEVWSRGIGLRYDEFASIQPLVCDEARSPFPTGGTFGRGALNYAYHLDAGQFGAFLRTHCEAHLDVSRIVATVTDVRLDNSGHIESLELDSGQLVLADLFIDCTGPAAKLISTALKAPFRSCRDQLIVDSAIAIQTPYPTPDSGIASATKSTAQSAGWIWDIGLQSRRGLGHVYSSTHCTEDEAILALAGYLSRPAGKLDETRIKLLKFEAGYRPTPWLHNCVSLGLASGFVEPLEATSIVMTDIGTDLICDLLQFDRLGMARAAAIFNDRMRRRWDGIIAFIKLHYVLSQRTDPFWRENRTPASIPETLAEYLDIWAHRPLTAADLPLGDDVFTIDSYHYILAGMQAPIAIPDWRQSALSDTLIARLWDRSRTANATFPERYSDHRRCLQELVTHD